MAYLTSAMTGAFLIFWEFGEEKINWTKLILYIIFFILSLFLAVEDILYKDRAAKEVTIEILTTIEARDARIRQQLDSISGDLRRLGATERSLQRNPPDPCSYRHYSLY